MTCNSHRWWWFQMVTRYLSILLEWKKPKLKIIHKFHFNNFHDYLQINIINLMRIVCWLKFFKKSHFFLYTIVMCLKVVSIIEFLSKILAIHHHFAFILNNKSRSGICSLCPTDNVHVGGVIRESRIFRARFFISTKFLMTIPKKRSVQIVNWLCSKLKSFVSISVESEPFRIRVICRIVLRDEMLPKYGENSIFKRKLNAQWTKCPNEFS